VEGYFVAFVEVTEARTLDSGEVNEHVRLTAALFDEAEALFAAEPLYLACCHVTTFSQLPLSTLGSYTGGTRALFDFGPLLEPCPCSSLGLSRTTVSVRG